MGLLLGWLGWLAGSVAFMAVAEYLIHRFIQHRPRRWASGVFRRHAILHHHEGRNDLNVDESPAYDLALASPILVPLAILGGWGPAAILAGVVVAHALLWTGLHRSIHDLGGRWARRLPGYAALRRHHELHHLRPGRNFGAAFGPIMDLICGTRARP